jgi:hypothetical protein
MVYRTSPTQWWRTFYQLGRKIEMQGGIPTATDIRKAAILRQLSEALAHATGPNRSLDQAVDSMEWVVRYGHEAFEAELSRRKAEALLGSER